MPPETLTVKADEEGLALLDFLAGRRRLSRRGAKVLLDERRVFVNGRRIWMARHGLKQDDTVQITGASHADETMPRILYRDAVLLAIDKPAGCLVTGANGLEGRLRDRLACPALRAVHRLDRDTTGCLLFALDESMLPELINSFREREVIKIYDVIVLGRANFKQRTLRMPLDGQSAVTHVHVISAGAAVSHLEARIETGRTHQIRRHLAAIGYPVIGDKQYGVSMICPDELRAVARHMLHASRLVVTHSRRLGAITIVAPVPEDFRACLARFATCKKKQKKR